MSVVKVNTDGAAKENSEVARAGCVLQDHNGKWLVGAAHNVSIVTSINAEL